MIDRTILGVRYCDDCKSEHLGPPCGLSFAQRLRSVQLHGSATPSREKKNYFSDEGLKDIFGKDRKEREEELLDETGGRRFVEEPDITKADIGI